LLGDRPRRSRRASRDPAPDDAFTVVSTYSTHSHASVPKRKNDALQRPVSLLQSKTHIDTAAARISFSPFGDKESTKIPEFKGTDEAKLNECIKMLESSNPCAKLVFCDGEIGSSAFTNNLYKVDDFLRGAIESRGKHGATADAPAALYVCGVPGVGKTSGVLWCCERAEESFRSDMSIVKFCNVNAAYLDGSKDPLQDVLSDLGKTLESKSTSRKQIENKMKRNEEHHNANIVILIVDEIDSLVGSKKSPNEKLLTTMMGWAKNENFQIALIGISNCMNDEKTSRLLSSGSVSFSFSY
jgi:Cdc6-like AAA superfamily ATPase